MWNQKNSMRNRFLQIQLPGYNSGLLNEITQIDLMNQFDRNKFAVSHKSIQQVKSKLPKDVKSSLSFGFWGLQKIVKEISSDESHIQLCAMITLSQLLLDKLEFQRAISEFDIVKRLRNVLLRRRQQKQKCQKLVPVILRCLVILTASLQASLQISKKPNLVNQLNEMAKFGDNIGISSCILKNLSQHPQVVDYFIRKTSWYFELCDHLKKNVIAFADNNLLEYFSQFLKIHPQIAVDRGFFEIIFHEIPNRLANQQILIKCFAFLLNCKEGQHKLEECDGIHVLYEILLDEHLETYEFIAQAFQNATAGSKILLWRCIEFWNLPNVLIQRAHVKNNDLQQLYCFQTLRQISPLIKQYIRCVCVPQIQSIKCNNEYVEGKKDALLIWLKNDVFKEQTKN